MFLRFLRILRETKIKLIQRAKRTMENNSLFHTVYNPDVLSCIANLSNDEVFTPPELENKIIDMLPQELFENPDTTFLDP